nr:glutamic acid-rich protein-like [Lepeophtheirus salmonis]
MGKIKAKNQKSLKGSLIEKAKVKKLPSKIKTEKVKEMKKLSLAAKFEVKKENIMPPVVSPKQDKSMKRKAGEDPVTKEGGPKKQKPQKATVVAASLKKKKKEKATVVEKETLKKPNPQKVPVVTKATPKKQKPQKATIVENPTLKNHKPQVPVIGKATPKKQKSLENSTSHQTTPKKQKSFDDQMKKNATPKKGKNEGKNKKKAPQVTTTHLSNAEKTQLLAAEQERKHQQDLRTLYIRFKNKKVMKTEDDVLKIHPQIKHVRIFRARKDFTKRILPIHFAFIEFESKKAALAAYKDLSPKSDDYFVDLMGPNSKTKKTPKPDDKKTGGKQKKEKSAAQINPLRLFVNGISSGISQSILRELFPKAIKAVIPDISNKANKLSKYGFLEFSNPIDAKAAFDASKDLEVNGHHITVLYARYENKNKSTDSTSSDQGTTPEVKSEKNDKIKLESEKDEEDDSESDVENDEDGSESDVENDEEEEEEMDEE